MKNSLRLALVALSASTLYLAQHHRRCPRKARSIPCAALTPRLQIRHRMKNSIQASVPDRKTRSSELFCNSHQ